MKKADGDAKSTEQQFRGPRTAFDRCAGTWHEMPEFCRCENWRPIDICREIELARTKIIEVSTHLPDAARKQRHDGVDAEKVDVLSTKKNISDLVAILNETIVDLDNASKNVSACVERYVRTAMYRSHASEVLGYGTLLSFGQQLQQPHEDQDFLRPITNSAPSSSASASSEWSVRHTVESATSSDIPFVGGH